MIFEQTIAFEPVSLKRHRHRQMGGTYDPSKKEKEAFIQVIADRLPEETNKMSRPIRATLEFYCKRPKTHYKSGKKSHELKETAPIYNTNNKDLDNMVKFVLDALNDRLYVDDRLIVELHCSKHYTAEPQGHIYVKFAEMV